MEDQAEAIDLLTAFAIDLLQPLAYQGGEIGAAQQGANQGANGGQGGTHLMGEGLKQGQFTAGARLRLLALTAVHQGLEGHAWSHGGQPLRQPRPERLRQLAIALQRAEALQRLPQPSALVRSGALQAPIQQGQGRRQGGWIKAHHQLPRLGGARQGHGHLQLGGDHQQQGITAIALLQGQPTEATEGLPSRRRTGGPGAGQQGSRLGEEVPQLLRSPHPALQLGEQGWFIEGRQGRGQPHPLQGLQGQQEILLKGGEGRPPLAANAVLVAAASGDTRGQQLPQGIQAAAG